MTVSLLVIAIAFGLAGTSLVIVLKALSRELRARARAEIMRLLADGQWHYGLDMIEASSGRLKRGTIYVHLSRLEDEGLVEGRREGGDESNLPRRRYRLRTERQPTFDPNCAECATAKCDRHAYAVKCKTCGRWLYDPFYAPNLGELPRPHHRENERCAAAAPDHGDAP